MGEKNGKAKIDAYPQAQHDFYKSNGSDHIVYNTEPSMTRQEFADECDINTLMKRYEAHGTSVNNLLALPAQGGQYLDFANIPDTLLGYMTFMQDAERAFMTLPALVRKEFDNNAYLFCEFASDPENLEQMRAWDLAPKAAPKAEEVVAPAAAPASSSSLAPATGEPGATPAPGAPGPHT